MFVYLTKYSTIWTITRWGMLFICYQLLICTEVKTTKIILAIEKDPQTFVYLFTISVTSPINASQKPGDRLSTSNIELLSSSITELLFWCFAFNWCRIGRSIFWMDFDCGASGGIPKSSVFVAAPPGLLWFRTVPEDLFFTVKIHDSDVESSACERSIVRSSSESLPLSPPSERQRW